MEILKYCKALADETRARLVNVLLRFELNVGEIVQLMEMGQSRISRHLKILADSGLVECRRDGLWAFYRASDSGPGRNFLDGVAPVMEGEAVFGQDLARAAKVIRERMAQTRQFFDSIADDWDRLNKEVLGSMDLRGEIVSRVSGCDVAADLGCGTGELLALMAQKSRTVIGVDSSPKMLELAEDRFHGDARVSLRIGELSFLPLRDWEADCVVVSLVLHHLARPLEALVEAGRVLKTGGRLVVAEFDKHDNEVMRTEYGDRQLGIANREMRGWLEKAGFEVREQTEYKVNMGLAVILYEAVRL
ncbi:ArsR/SmtB family transcription factor [Pseudodesulfovibrio senegalensis]|jgi:ArsR family transcriptional regulator|uniref:Metalloregulator ArsR/SmtB family transcription factor n=1 Tax=Pseudodesulfovibrio senegalensis TaxID=1721087 RepID=A0A6N6N3C1_9BACT|nr:metalloregulator ArsR/SmtB family transcription factor [Pseudodesulfovibrio senegalensis]KAB1442067.1 metalloregulator ArsR/SmtB family transcription factor [Pseudodesulfovibrio senegalensis]